MTYHVALTADSFKAVLIREYVSIWSQILTKQTFLRLDYNT